MYRHINGLGLVIIRMFSVSTQGFISWIASRGITPRSPELRVDETQTYTFVSYWCLEGGSPRAKKSIEHAFLHENLTLGTSADIAQRPETRVSLGQSMRALAEASVADLSELFVEEVNHPDPRAIFNLEQGPDLTYTSSTNLRSPIRLDHRC